MKATAVCTKKAAAFGNWQVKELQRKQGYFHFVLRFVTALYKSFNKKYFHNGLLKMYLRWELLTPSTIKSSLIENYGPAFSLINY